MGAEIQVMERCATLDHPNIVSYYGTHKKIFEAKDAMPRRVEYFILLEFMHSSLIDIIKQNQQSNKIIPEKQLLSLFLDIVNATQLLHSQKPPIAHRDIKIDNVLITYIQTANGRNIRLKLCDFGSCVNGTPKICDNTQQINIESELIERFTTPSYRSPEMIDLYQRKELSTKVDIWALGVVLFLLAYYEHPYPEGAKMSILDAKYKIPHKDRYSKKVTKILKLCFHRDPVRRPTCKQIIDHITSIISGGKGTLSSKYKKRSNSANPQQLHLSPKKTEDTNRRKSLQPKQSEHKMDAIDDEWDPFSDDNTNDNDDIFSDNFSDLQIVSANDLKANDVSSNGQSEDPFFSNDFASDFFGDGDKAKKQKSKVPKKRKSGIKPKAINSAIYTSPKSEERQSRRKKKKKRKPTKSRSQSPASKNSKVKNKNKKKAKPQTPPPQPDDMKDPNVVYGDQLAQLISMGFNDEQKNINAIARAKGNVQVAVNTYHNVEAC